MMRGLSGCHQMRWVRVRLSSHGLRPLLVMQPMRSDHGVSLFLSPGNRSVSDLCHTGASRAVSTLKPYS